MYRTTSLFSYAEPYYSIFPCGLEENREVGNGSIVIEEEYIIYFKPETPEHIKQRFIHDYAEYHKKQKESGVYY